MNGLTALRNDGPAPLPTVEGGCGLSEVDPDAVREAERQEREAKKGRA